MQYSRGSARRLFLIIYVVGTVVTMFLSNDATAVVLTPAVYAATRAARVVPLPYLFICAFIANAASFVLPISNPANLVVFGAQMPPLQDWLRYFAPPSLVAIVATYIALRSFLVAKRPFVRKQHRVSGRYRLAKNRGRQQSDEICSAGHCIRRDVGAGANGAAKRTWQPNDRRYLVQDLVRPSAASPRINPEHPVAGRSTPSLTTRSRRTRYTTQLVVK